MRAERRGGGLRQRESDTRPYAERILSVTTKLERFTLMAREEPEMRFTSLMGLLSEPEGLRESFESQDGRKAPGVDGVRKEDYGQGLEARLAEVSARIRRGMGVIVRLGCRASKTAWYKSGLAVFCRRSGNRSSATARSDFVLGAVRMMRCGGSPRLSPTDAPNGWLRPTSKAFSTISRMTTYCAF